MNGDDLKKYIKEPVSTKQSVRETLRDDTFIMDALDGLEMLNEKDLKRLDRRFKKNLAWLNFSVFVLVFSSFLLGTYFMTKKIKSDNSPISKVSQNSSNVKSVPHTQITPIADSTGNPNNPIERALEHIIHSTSLMQDQHDQRRISTNNSLNPNDRKQRKNDIVEMPLIVPSNVDLKPYDKTGRETYLQDLLVLDYRHYRTKPKIELNPILNGVPASYEQNLKKETIENELDLSYMNFLSKTLEYLNKAQYEIAANRFEIVLRKFPDDVNALFYGSICYYNLKKYSDALLQLQKLAYSKFTNFRQDQEWYSLLCYKAIKNKKEFERMKIKIIDGQGFYQIRAKEMEFN